MDLRTRSRGKPQSKRAWREESEPEEEDEERLVPVVSGENKRKRAPRGGSNVRRVKVKALNYEGVASDDRVEGSEEEENSKGESGEADAGVKEQPDALVEKRQSSRVKIKTFKLRENAESETKVARGSKTGGGGAQKKGDDEDAGRTVVEASPPPPQRPLKVHITLSDGKQKPSINSTPASDLKPVQQQQQQQQKTKAGYNNPPQSPPEKTIAPPAKTNDDVDQAELDTSLKVIKKLMKMDAAHPFNRPVDPIGQGVPDYLEIIDTPMDFGTICQTLERKQKYKNALDVYKDIQQIWTNCRKYNHKGDPILEMMKKVQKACSKYWTANGVLRDPKKPHSKKGEVQVAAAPEVPSDATTGGHKANCNCVVCVAVRRKSAKEKRAVGLGSARAVKRQITKLKGKQELNEAEMEELMQLDEAYTEQMEEADHYFPASYQVPLRPVNPLVLSLGQALFGCRTQMNKPSSMANPLLPLVASYKRS